MFVAVVNRYFERLTWTHKKLQDALAEAESEEHFFIGAVDTDSRTAYLPRVTAIGYSHDLAVTDLEKTTGLKIAKVEYF